MKTSPRMPRALVAGLASVIAMLPFAAFADVNANLNGSAAVATPPVSGTAQMQTGTSVKGSTNTSTTASGSADSSTEMHTMQASTSGNVKGRASADKEIDRRIASLNTLIGRVSTMKNVSADEKATLQTTLGGEVSTLTSLRAKVDADNATDLKTDAQSITKDYRVYALVIPQSHIVATADRVATIASMMQSMGVKLQTRISAAQTAGKNVSAAQSAYTDMQAKIADANAKATAAVNETAVLKPDQGSASVMASNTATLKDAAAKLKTANADLKAARADISTILKTVHGVGAAASATTTVTAQ